MTMQWKKYGVVWQPDGQLEWARKYATAPTPFLLPDGRLRIFAQSRDDSGVGRVGYVDVDPENPLHILRVSKKPVLDIGTPGAFDDNGVCQVSMVKMAEGHINMYYVGFELCHRIRYRLLTGLAVSRDGGESFHRVKTTPILERSPSEMFFRGSPFVLPDPNGGFRMWYAGGSKWEEIEGKFMPVYDVRYITSADGIHWPGEGRVVLSPEWDKEHGCGRPYIVTRQNVYQMFYSIRKRFPRAFRIGYAESIDGLHWQRKDDECVGLDVSTEGWDSEAIGYTAVIDVGDRTFCFYNGNDFGSTGFGVAELMK